MHLMHRNPALAVDAVIVKNKKIVLIKRKREPHRGRYALPGGFVEYGETVEAALQREVLEETGLKIMVERLTGVYKNLTHGIVALVYRCRPADGDAQPTAEAREVRWMTREEVQSAMNPAFAVRVLDAFDEDAHSRAHDQDSRHSARVDSADGNAFEVFSARLRVPTCGFVDTRSGPPLHLLLRVAIRALAESAPKPRGQRMDRPGGRGIMSSLKRRGLSRGCRPVVLLAFGLRVGSVG